ncbi:MAG: flagellar hook basal-body protein [Planctomycetes bacterium]|nr:flagellar hook basal-body protein [Planctomycetota bacterium]
MSKGIHSAASAMQVHARRVEIIADNLANLSTTAFKRRTTSVGAFEHKLDPHKDHALRTTARQDFDQGVIVTNGEPYNLALDGKGFFAVEGKDGELYTRNGNFRLDEAGEIRTAENLLVAWESKSGSIDPAGAAVSIGRDGSVKQGSEPLGRLRVVDFDEPQRLHMVEGGYFRAPEELVPGPALAEVKQSALESSNSNAVREVIELVEAQRAFELASSVLSQHDQSYRRLTRQI